MHDQCNRTMRNMCRLLERRGRENVYVTSAEIPSDLNREYLVDYEMQNTVNGRKYFYPEWSVQSTFETYDTTYD